MVRQGSPRCASGPTIGRLGVLERQGQEVDAVVDRGSGREVAMEEGEGRARGSSRM